MTSRASVHLFCPVLLLMCAAGAHARDDVAQRLDVQLSYTRVRSRAPVHVRARFLWNGTSLLEGQLELAFVEGRETLCTYRSPELALTAGEQEIGFLLPALTVSQRGQQVTVRVNFVTGHRRIALPSTSWLVPHSEERSCVVGVSHDGVQWEESTSRLLRVFRLEGFERRREDEDERRTRAPRALQTMTTRVNADEMPAQPLGYCSFDVLVLPGRGFSYLRERQLTAILRWVRAGGSVCVVPGGALRSRHAQFLNDLVADGGPTFAIGADGRLRVARGANRPEPVVMHRICLGRAAVVLDPPADDEEQKAPWLRDVSAFLWKMRVGNRQAIKRDGTWPASIRLRTADSRYYMGQDDRSTPVHVKAIHNLGGIVQGLMPSQVRMIPFGVVVLILLLFVAAIGPMDYYVLGLLRARKFTWVLFPLVAVGFAYFTVKLSDHYMGRRDQRRAFTFVDVDAVGQPVRHHRYEFIFAATERDTRFELENALFYPLGRSEEFVDEMSPYYRGPGYGRPDLPPGPSADKARPIAYEGRLPGSFTATQKLYQWTPQVNGSFSLDPPEDMPDLDWGAIKTSDVQNTRLRRNIPSLLYRHGSVTGTVLLLHMNNVECLSRPVQPPPFLFGRNGHGGLLQAASARLPHGLFSIVSQISPTGSPDFEDTAVLDSSDSLQWLLVVVEQTGDDIIICRRLFHGDS